VILRNPSLLALLVAEVVSSVGSRMTALALPWFVLVTTGSPPSWLPSCCLSACSGFPAERSCRASARGRR
jgi:hypothetical protein